MSQNGDLKELDCSNNDIRELDLSQNTRLTRLDCPNNGLGKLDLSQNTELTSINCENNGIYRLDATNCNKLRHITCHSNSLKNNGLNLPDYSTEYGKTIYFKIMDNIPADQNKLTPAEVQTIRQKGWYVMAKTWSSWNDYKGED